jgi:hypothetical protein
MRTSSRANNVHRGRPACCSRPPERAPGPGREPPQQPRQAAQERCDRCPGLLDPPLGRHRMWAGPPRAVVCRRVVRAWEGRSSAAPIAMTHFSSGADGTGHAESAIPQSAVVLASKYPPLEKHSTGTQLLREVSDGCTTTRAGLQDNRTDCLRR